MAFLWLGNLFKSTITANENVPHVIVDNTIAVEVGSANIGDAASATQAGVVPLAIRDDALSALADPEGDLVGTRADAKGALWTITSPDDAGVASLASIKTAVELLDNAVKNEDDASANGDGGFVIFAKRGDNDYEDGGGTGANGDYQSLNCYGPALQVRVAASNAAADNTKSIAAREDDASANNAAGVKTLAVRRDAPTQSAGTDGDFCFPGVSADGGAWEQGAFKAGTAVVDASLTADYTSAAHDCRGFNVWVLDYQVADNSAGVMYIQGSQDGTNHWQDIPLDTASVRINAGGVAWTGVTVAATGITHTDPGAGGAKVSMTFENPMPYMRYFFDRTGGDAGALDSQSALQAF